MWGRALPSAAVAVLLRGTAGALALSSGDPAEPEGPPPGARPPTAAPPLVSPPAPRPTTPPALLTTTEVAERFELLTADRLRPANRSPTYEALSLMTRDATDATRASFRYGSFTLYVFGSFATAGELAARGAGHAPPATPEGVYWERFGSQWEARKAFGNVVLSWTGGRERRTDERWDRLVRILTAMGRPAGSATAMLPPEERPCEQAGIDPKRGREGTCKLGRQMLVVVNADRGLDLPLVAIRGMEVRSGERITIAGRRGTLARARGTFVLLRFLVTNKGERELSTLFSRLAVGDRRFEPGGQEALFEHDLPLRPGETGEATAVFDIPRGLGRRALTEGGFEVAGDPEAFVTVEDARIVGRVRLSKAAQRGAPGRRAVIARSGVRADPGGAGSSAHKGQ